MQSFVTFIGHYYKNMLRAEYKKQETAWVETGNSEPYKGQNMAEYDKKFDDMKAEQTVKLAEAHVQRRQLTTKQNSRKRRQNNC